MLHVYFYRILHLHRIHIPADAMVVFFPFSHGSDPALRVLSVMLTDSLIHSVFSYKDPKLCDLFFCLAVCHFKVHAWYFTMIFSVAQFLITVQFYCAAVQWIILTWLNCRGNCRCIEIWSTTKGQTCDQLYKFTLAHKFQKSNNLASKQIRQESSYTSL